MKKRILTLALALALLVALVMPSVALAADTGVVVCTVSGELISVLVTDGTVDYGVLAADGTANTVGTQTQLVTNDGNVDEDFTVMSSDATGGTTPWTLAATTDVDQYTHESSPDGGSAWTFMESAAYVALASDVIPTGTADLDLRITMPTSISDGAAKSIDVTVLATESP